MVLTTRTVSRHRHWERGRVTATAPMLGGSIVGL